MPGFILTAHPSVSVEFNLLGSLGAHGAKSFLFIPLDNSGLWRWSDPCRKIVSIHWPEWSALANRHHTCSSEGSLGHSSRINLCTDFSVSLQHTWTTCCLLSAMILIIHRPSSCVLCRWMTAPMWRGVQGRCCPGAALAWWSLPSGLRCGLVLSWSCSGLTSC